MIDGDPSSSTDPNAQESLGSNLVNFASASRGTVGTWTATANTINARKKHITWTAFGQVIAADGVYAGNPGSLELEGTVVNGDSTLATMLGTSATG